MKGPRLFILSVFCVSVFSACGGFRGTSEPVRFYLLEAEVEGENRVDADTLRVPRPSLLVALPQPAPGFETPRMAYELVPHELQYFAASQWVDSPARLLGPLVTRTLEQSQAWESVVQEPSVIQGDFRLDLSGVALVQDFTQRPSRVRFSLRAQLLKGQEPRVVGTRHYEFWEEAPSENPYGGVQAAHHAVRRFLSELKAWLQGCLGTGQSSPC